MQDNVQINNGRGQELLFVSDMKTGFFRWWENFAWILLSKKPKRLVLAGWCAKVNNILNFLSNINLMKYTIGTCHSKYSLTIAYFIQV